MTQRWLFHTRIHPWTMGQIVRYESGSDGSGGRWRARSIASCRIRTMSTVPISSVRYSTKWRPRRPRRPTWRLRRPGWISSRALLSGRIGPSWSEVSAAINVRRYTRACRRPKCAAVHWTIPTKSCSAGSESRTRQYSAANFSAGALHCRAPRRRSGSGTARRISPRRIP
jgi:hypothetical protein